MLSYAILLAVTILIALSWIVYRYAIQSSKQTILQQQKSIQHLSQTLNNHQSEYKQLQENLMRDSATGYLNRPHFIDKLETQFTLSQKYNRPLTLALLHLTNMPTLLCQCNFTLIDTEIQKLTNCINATFRELDLIGRLSDSQIAIALLDSGLENTQMISARFLENFHQIPRDLHVEITMLPVNYGNSVTRNLQQLINHSLN